MRFDDAIGRLFLWLAFWFVVIFAYGIIYGIVVSMKTNINPYVLLGILVFISTLALMDALTHMTWKKTHKKESIHVLDKREIRRALIITFTIIYIILLFQGEGSSLNSSLLEHFTWIYFAMISFYFGSRALDRFAEVMMEKGKVKDR